MCIATDAEIDMFNKAEKLEEHIIKKLRKRKNKVRPLLLCYFMLQKATPSPSVRHVFINAVSAL